MSYAEVSAKTDIPEATLYRYENGITKKIPLESIKKLAKLYNVDYGFASFPLFGTLTGITLSALYGISFTSVFNGANIGFLLGAFGYKKMVKYFEKIKSDNPKESLYNQLTEEEKEEYNAFKSMTYSFLKTKQVFSKDEIEDDETFLLSYYFAHKVKREIKIIDINEKEE